MKKFFPIIIAFTLINSSCFKDPNPPTSGDNNNGKQNPQSVLARTWAVRSLRVLESRVDQAELALTNYVPPVMPIPKLYTKPEFALEDKLLRLIEEAFRVEANLIINRIIYEETKSGHVTQLPEEFIETKIDTTIPLADRLKTDHERQVRYENIIKTQFEKLRLKVNRENGSIIEYKILKQNLETAQSMYEEFKRKAEKSGIELSRELIDRKNTL
jgi:hypothetical protein